jgi:hypothetical protein
MTGEPARAAKGATRIRSRRVAVFVASLAVACVTFGASAAVGQCAPWWHVSSNVLPAVLSPGGEGEVTLRATNIGDTATVGPVHLTDTLPAGLEVVEEEVEGQMVPAVEFVLVPASFGQRNLGLNGGFIASLVHMCSLTGNQVSCSSEGAFEEFVFTLNPYEDMEIRMKVKDEGPVGKLTNRIEVSGGEARATAIEPSIEVGTEAPTFGIEQSSLSVVPEEDDGTVDALAGSHPFQLTTSFNLRQNADPFHPPGLPKDVSIELPAGVVGNATSLPQCSDHDFHENVHNSVTVNHCSAASVIGVASVTIDEPDTLKFDTLPVPVFNLVPEAGEPARFGFEAAGAVVTLDPSIRTGSDYGVTVSVHNLTQLAATLASTVTIWGTPGDSRHAASRGWGCLINEHYATESEGSVSCERSQGVEAKPFLTLPTICNVPFATTVSGDSWPIKETVLTEPVVHQFGPVGYTLSEGTHEIELTGCDQLAFDPSMEAQLDTNEASSPAGITVRVRVPQVTEGADGRASSTIKDITVALPEGVSVNPASAGGLAACTESEVGFEGNDAATGVAMFSPSLPANFCPEASKIATVEAVSPLLPATQHLVGALYLASQNANPFGSLIAFYMVMQNTESGVLVKLPGEVKLDPNTGRITATIKNVPPLPFEEAVVKFFGGSRAALASPTLCGQPSEERYRTTASFAPWSGGEAIQSASGFGITSGPGGAPCPNAVGDQSPTTVPFAPKLKAGTAGLQAGGYTSIATHVERSDGEQEVGALSFRLPPGLAGVVASVVPCGETAADEGTCGPDSLIGQASVTVGVGTTPYQVNGGQVFLTGPYRGAPFGLSITSPAKAGPFDLGKGACDCIVVRASLSIDPHTTQVTVTTDSSGPNAIPRMLEGIPLKIRSIDATVNRPHFAFNPTNCEPMSITGDFASVLGASASATVPFQVANCARLGFAPKFSATVNGKWSKRDGVAFGVKLAYPQGSFGTQANIAKVKVVLPRQLPSRLSTLQEACLAKVFEADPTKCPAHSLVGHATVKTPVLPVPLTGSAYFVAEGGAQFPLLILVLKGDNVTVDVVGNTAIKHGITTSTFKATPDVPFSSFELTLPQGPFSALGAFSNLCNQKLSMATEIVGQNGAVLTKPTKIAVTHCARPARAKSKSAKRHASRAQKPRKQRK